MSFKLDRLFLFIISLAVNCDSKNVESKLRVIVDAGEKSCFWLPKVRSGNDMTLAYRVVKASGLTAVHDIEAGLWDPNGFLIKENRPKPGKGLVIKHKAEVDGDYKFCFNNGFSHFSSKTVQFYIWVSGDFDPYDQIDSESLKAMKLMDADYYIEQYVEETIKSSLDSIQAFLKKTSDYAYVQGVLTTYDHNTLEEHADKIMIWGSLQLAMVIFVAMVQVLMIKSLFSDRSFIYSLTK